MVIWEIFLESYESNINVVLIILNIQSNMLCKFTFWLPFIEVHKQAKKLLSSAAIYFHDL